MPIKSTVPTLGTKCGRRERESRREGRREQSLRGKSIPSRVVTVKGILIIWKAAPFAGCCRNEGLGRSVIQVAVSPATSWRADDSECPKDAEEGNVVSMRHKAYAPDARHERSWHALIGDASFARSFDPCTSILTMHRR
jgi:hypothetical protein